MCLGSHQPSREPSGGFKRRPDKLARLRPLLGLGKQEMKEQEPLVDGQACSDEGARTSLLDDQMSTEEVARTLLVDSQADSQISSNEGAETSLVDGQTDSLVDNQAGSWTSGRA